MNKVIAGKYDGKSIMVTKGKAVIVTSPFKPLELSSENISNYEVITEEHRKSAASGVARGLVGGALIGPVGMLAGGLSAKNKGTYQIAIEFNDGCKSLIEINSKIYKILIKQLFNNENRANEYVKDSVIKNKKSNKIIAMIFIPIILISLLIISQLDGTQRIGNNTKTNYKFVVAKKRNGLDGDIYFVSIRTPENLDVNDIARKYLDKYDKGNLESLTIYMHDENVEVYSEEMFKNSTYELTINILDNYSYYLWDMKEDVEIENGTLEL